MPGAASVPVECEPTGSHGDVGMSVASSPREALDSAVSNTASSTTHYADVASLGNLSDRHGLVRQRRATRRGRTMQRPQTSGGPTTSSCSARGDRGRHTWCRNLSSKQ